MTWHEPTRHEPIRHEPTWHESTDHDDALGAVETVAHWVGADISTVAHALASLEPRRLARSEGDKIRKPRTAKGAAGEPVDLDKWDVIVTANLPIALRHKPGVVEVWRCSVDWQGVSHRTLQMVDEPVVIELSDGREPQQTKQLLKAIAEQRTKQARRSTVCTWCGTTMVKGERYSTYCCYDCATTVKGVVH